MLIILIAIALAAGLYVTRASWWPTKDASSPVDSAPDSPDGKINRGDKR